MQNNKPMTEQNIQANQDLKEQPYQKSYSQSNQQNQNNSSQIMAQYISYDQNNIQQTQQYQQPQQYQQQPQQYQQQPQQYQQQPQYYNPQQQMQPQQYQQQYYPQQNYQQQTYPQQIDAQYINNDVNYGQPYQQYIPQGQPQVRPNQIIPIYTPQTVNAIINIQPPNATGALIVLTDNTLRSADGFRFPATIICPTCNVKGQTIVQHESSDSKHIYAIILCLACPPLCFIPYLCEDCDNIRHYCPTCKSKVGVKYYRSCD